MEHLFAVVFLLHARAALALFASLAAPFAVGFVRYHARDLSVLLHKAAHAAFAVKDPAPLTEAQAPSVLVVLPTELRNAADLACVKRAISSVIRNGYLGHLTIVAAVDDAPANLGAYRDLLAWITIVPRASHVQVCATSTGTRTGRAGAIDNAIQFVRAKVAKDELDMVPAILFTMDAESFLGPNSIEHMAQRLRRPRWKGLRTTRPMMVVGNVQSDPRTPAPAIERGLRAFFSLRGQLSLADARKSLTSTSRALTCTWTELQEQAPRWTAFVETLTVGEWCRWSIGKGARSFSRKHAPFASPASPSPSRSRAHAADASATWLASMARYTERGTIVLDLPKSPAHALVRALGALVWTPIGYEPMALSYVSSPATAATLFRSRMPAASHAMAALAAWSPAFAYHWGPGLAAFARVASSAYVQLSFAWALVSWPLVHARDGGTLAAITLAIGLTMANGASTLLALSLDRHVRLRARVLLAVPLSLAFDASFTLFPALLGLAMATSRAAARTASVVWTNVRPRSSATPAMSRSARDRSKVAPEPTMIISDLSRLAPQAGRMSASPSMPSMPARITEDFSSLRVPHLTLVSSAPPSTFPEPRRANRPPPSEGKMLSIRVPPPSNVVSLAAARAKITRQLEAMVPRIATPTIPLEDPMNNELARTSAGPER